MNNKTSSIIQSLEKYGGNVKFIYERMEPHHSEIASETMYYI